MLFLPFKAISKNVARKYRAAGETSDDRRRIRRVLVRILIVDLGLGPFQPSAAVKVPTVKNRALIYVHQRPNPVKRSKRGSALHACIQGVPPSNSILAVHPAQVNHIVTAHGVKINQAPFKILKLTT